MALPVAALAAGAGVGALAGMLGSRSTQTAERVLPHAGALENQIYGAQGQDFTAYRDLINSSINPADVSAGLDSQRGLAELLKKLMQTGGIPDQGQIQQGQQFAQQLFAPQQQMLNQRFKQQELKNNQLMARMGRGPTDPVLQNLLAQGQLQQQGQLDSEIGAYGTQWAMNQPMQQLNFANQLSQVQGGLASQALQRRSELLAMGNNMLGNERNFRVGASSSSVTSMSGGGIQGALMGAMAGAGTGAQVYGYLNKPSDPAKPDYSRMNQA